MRFLLIPLILAGCTTTEPFEGYDKAALVNRSVNSKLDYTYDDDHRGTARIMQPGESGRCGDFALTKCKLLVDAGFSPSRLSFIWYERDPTYSNPATTHAVCVVDGKWALDFHANGYPFLATKENLNAKDGTELHVWQTKGWRY